MEAAGKWSKNVKLETKPFLKHHGRVAVAKNLSDLLRTSWSLQIPSQCAGSCPDLMMSRTEPADPGPVAMALTPQLPPRAPRPPRPHRPLCLSVSSDSSGRFRALDSLEWRNNLKAQMEQAHSVGAASSTGSLERASLFCAAGGSAGGSSPVEVLQRTKSSGRFSLFSPPWNSSSESDSNPPSRTGSTKLRNYSRRAATGPAGAGRAPDPAPGPPSPRASPGEQVQYSEPVISKVTDYIFVGNLNAAYSGRALCRNNIDSVIDTSGSPALSLIPCTCSRRARHSWSRLKVDMELAPGDAPTLQQRCFQDINGCMEASAERKKRVLVHCGDGSSLAPTVVIQYLMVKHHMRLLPAYELLRSRHPLNIRERHQDVLVALERTLHPGGGMAPEGFKQALSRRLAWT
ncbi:unnamed protein product [Boreogadus saida]|uniref:uncharacterized protein LOC132464319 n=1 Tax=Gadus macrocephalus TaxID=80720 RepID=UPI0028CB707D|nr:uncharacterized protein LOC132464319 [Gadus macrocephalus]XP_059916618.1 uncharacterized protein LOC132464319 [Gadus macrocephalus]